MAVGSTPRFAEALTRAAAVAAGGAPPLPHLAAAGMWKVIPGANRDPANESLYPNNPAGHGWDDQPAITVRAITRAEADRLEAATAAAWDAAAARAPAALRIINVTSRQNARTAIFDNGTYECVPGARAPGGAPVFERQHWWGNGTPPWLFLAQNNKWTVGSTARKNARTEGLTSTLDAVAAGTLPHEARFERPITVLTGTHN